MRQVATSLEKVKASFREHPGLRAAAGAGVALCGVVATFAAAPGSPPSPAVLAAKADLPVGTVLTAADLQAVHDAKPGAEAAPAFAESTFLGKSLRVELPAGMLLGQSDIGAYPPSGYAQVSLALKPGQYPSNLVDGQQVGIVPLAADGAGPYVADAGASTPANSSGAGGAQVIDGQLVSMTPDMAGGSDGDEIANVLVPVSQAANVIAAPSAGLMGLDGAGQ